MERERERERARGVRETEAKRRFAVYLFFLPLLHPPLPFMVVELRRLISIFAFGVYVIEVIARLRFEFVFGSCLKR